MMSALKSSVIKVIIDGLFLLSPKPIMSLYSDIYVIKRDSTKQQYDQSKIKAYLELISRDLHNIDVPYVLKCSSAFIVQNVHTTEILDQLIKLTSNLITAEQSDYQYVASRLLVNAMRREVWNSFYPVDSLHDRVKDRVSKGYYDKMLLEKYTIEDYDVLESIIDYDKDYILTYSGMRQFYDKYLIKNRVTNKLYELPQEANILICATMFMNTDKSKRMDLIRTMYKYLSNLVLSLATPVYAGVRGILRSFSSCCVIDCGDTTDSILSTNFFTSKAVTKRFGIGININKIRGIGASVANGAVIHTGIVPFLKMFEASTRGFMQNGIRGGQGTISFPFWNWEVLTLIELRNNKGVQENRVRSLDYSIGLNKLFFQRVLDKNDDAVITLFSAEEVPLLSNDYTYSHEEFTRIYCSYEANQTIRKQTINAKEFIKRIARERFETGRLYVYFMDNMNHYGSFTESIFSSNLCQEIALPTKPVNMLTGEGLIAICILSCINVGRLVDKNNNMDWNALKECCTIIVQFLNEMIDYQEYICPQIECSARDYRPLGIGISDLFHLLAKKGLAYDSVACRDFAHELAERFQYYLLEASNELAKQHGACNAFTKTKYAQGLLPIDRYKKANVDKLTSSVNYVCDWDDLRERISKYGLRNTSLSAIPPTASSCSISNSTPGIDPPRSIVTAKMSKYGTFNQVVPDIDECLNTYTFQHHIDNDKYFQLIGVIQKFIDQGISTNSFYMNESGDQSFGDIIKELTSAYKYGLKTLYYLNSNKKVDTDIKRAFSSTGINKSFNSSFDSQPSDDIEGCSGGACKL